MKKIILILIVCILIGSICYAEESISKENQVILSSEWEPNEEQTKNVLVQILEFLNNIEENTDYEYYISSTKRILEEIDQYRVQFKGVVKDGKKILHCNFFHISDMHLNWKEVPAIVRDGGYWYWQIDYDIEEGKCISFYINGEA